MAASTTLVVNGAAAQAQPPKADERTPFVDEKHMHVDSIAGRMLRTNIFSKSINPVSVAVFLTNIAGIIVLQNAISCAESLVCEGGEMYTSCGDFKRGMIAARNIFTITSLFSLIWNGVSLVGMLDGIAAKLKIDPQYYFKKTSSVNNH